MKRYKQSLALAGGLFILIVILPTALTILLAWRGYNGRTLALDMWTASQSGALITRRDIVEGIVYLTTRWAGIAVAVLVGWWLYAQLTRQKSR